MKNGRFELEFGRGVGIILWHKEGHFPFDVGVDAGGILVKRENYSEDKKETILENGY